MLDRGQRKNKEKNMMPLLINCGEVLVEVIEKREREPGELSFESVGT